MKLLVNELLEARPLDVPAERRAIQAGLKGWDGILHIVHLVWAHER